MSDILKTSIQARYGAVAQNVSDGVQAEGCCGTSGCCGSSTEAWDPITSDLYDEAQRAGLPADAVLASLGCGNPTALAELNEGEVVLDLGSGGPAPVGEQGSVEIRGAKVRVAEEPDELLYEAVIAELATRRSGV